jgi:hypothetical protein
VKLISLRWISELLTADNAKLHHCIASDPAIRQSNQVRTFMDYSCDYAKRITGQGCKNFVVGMGCFEIVKRIPLLPFTREDHVFEHQSPLSNIWNTTRYSVGSNRLYPVFLGFLLFIKLVVFNI